MMRKVQLLCGAAISFWMLAGGAARAQEAQQSPDQQPEAQAAQQSAQTSADIIVTARRREETLEEVPSAASAFGGEELRRFNVESGLDLTQFTPGLYVINNGSGINNEIIIRGEGATRLNNVETGSGLYRDQMYIPGGNAGGRDFAPIDFFDIDRIEVLRGPQGSYFGRNAVGGAVNIVTQRPVQRNEGFFELGAGSQQTYGVEAVGNVPLSSSVALRVGGFVDLQESGFYRSSITGEVLDQERSYGVRGQLRFQPSSALTIDLLAEYADQEAPRPEVFEFVLPVNDPPYNNPGPTGFSIDRFSKPIDSPTVFTREIETYRADVSYDLGGVTFQSITGLRRRFATSEQDVDFQAPNPVQRLLSATGVADESFERFYQDLRLTSAPGARFFWLVGAEYTTVDSTLNQLTSAIVPSVRPPECVPALPCSLPALQNAARNAFRDQTSGLDDKSYAVYGAITWEVTDRLTLSADARYTVDEKSFANEEVRRLNNPATPANEQITRSFEEETTFKRLTPGASLTYEVGDDTNIYARVATAYRSGGFNNDQGEPNDGVSDIVLPLIYEPEDVIGYELGIKGRLGTHRYAFNGYYTSKDDTFVNYAVFVGCPAAPPRPGCPANTVRNVGVISNQGESYQYGFEGELTGRLFNGTAGRLDYRASVTWADGEHKEGVQPTNSPGNPSGTLTNESIEGNRQSRLREWTLTGTLSYAVPVGNDVEIFSNLQGRAELGGFEDARNNIPFDDVTLVNGSIGLGALDRRWSISLQVRNLLDEEYFTINPLNPQFGTQVNEPRTFLVRYLQRF